MPNAVFFAFSGTPIDKKDRSTYRVFVKLLDRYSFEESKADGVTLPIFYKGSRGFEVHVWDNPQIFKFLNAKDAGETAQDTATDDKNEKLVESLRDYDKKINGEQAVTFVSSESGLLKKVVTTIHNDVAYDFTYSSGRANFEDDKEIMNHIFDSVRFN